MAMLIELLHLKERFYGKHNFKAAMLMRQGVLVGGMLTNSECWINVTKKDIEDLEKPDIFYYEKCCLYMAIQANALCNCNWESYL